MATKNKPPRDFLAESLERMAYVVPGAPNRQSRFWFKLDSPREEVTKEVMKPKTLEHIDSDIVERLEEYKKNSPDLFKAKLEQVREFFLNDVAPLTIASSGGAIQAAEVLGRMLDTEIDASTAARFQQMVNRATTLKMAQFVATYFSLPPGCVDSIIGTPVGPPDIRTVLNQIEASNSKTQNTVIGAVSKLTKLVTEKREKKNE